MKPWKLAIALAAISLLLAVALAAAQEPVRSFDQLDTRLKPGDKVWVTDAQGREIRGRVAALEADSLTIDAGGLKSFAASDVRFVVERRGDSLGNGALIGLGVGGATFGVACYANTSGSDQDWCPLVTAFYGGVGAAVGVAIDALIPGRKLVVYRAPGAPGHARLSIAPLVTPRAKGVAFAFAF
jgi:hypothetical protein